MIYGPTGGGSDTRTGDVIVVRYADDTIVGFEHQHEAERFLVDLKARFARFGLTLHPDKTRLIEFGQSAIANRRTRDSESRSRSTSSGSRIIARPVGAARVLCWGGKPVAKRMRAKLREIKEQLMTIRHEGPERQGRWLCQVLRGWMAYYAVPMSGSAISAFRHTHDRTLARRSDASKPKTSINVDENEEDR